MGIIEEDNNETVVKLGNIKPKETLKLILTIVLVVGVGLICVNQYMSFRYKAYFLGDPCGLCSELNPHLNYCFMGYYNIDQEEYKEEKESFNYSNIKFIDLTSQVNQ